MTNNDEMALNAEQCAIILENISGFEPDDIDGDAVDLRFDLDGMDTGCTVSIVEQCQDAADTLRALLAERDADKKRIAELESQRQMAFMACNRWADKCREAESKLEARTVSVKLPKPISVLYRRDFNDAHQAIYAYAEAEVNAALSDAGINLEVGE